MSKKKLTVLGVEEVKLFLEIVNVIRSSHLDEAQMVSFSRKVGIIFLSAVVDTRRSEKNSIELMLKDISQEIVRCLGE